MSIDPSYNRHRGFAWLLFVLIAALSVDGEASNGMPGQYFPGAAPPAGQAGVTGVPENSPREAPSSSLPPAKTGPAVGNAGEALAEKYDLVLGKSVFNHACLTCHGNSVRDAPRVGDMHAWQPRLAQGLDVLIQHALAGHGRMPPKGGYITLTEREVASAVAYIYQRGTEILAQRDKPIAHEGCDPVSNLYQCSPEELRRVFILQMLWLLSGPRQ